MILYDSTGKPHVIRPAYPEPRELPVALYRVQGFSVALEDRPEGIVATVVDVPGVTATVVNVRRALRDMGTSFGAFSRLSQVSTNSGQRQYSLQARSASS